MKKIILLLLVTVPVICFGQTKKLYRKALRTVDLNEKITILTQVIHAEPNHLDAYFYRAIAKNDLKDFHGAIVDYSKIIVEAPDADSYYNRGNSRYSLQDFVGAKEDYAKAFMLDNHFLDALYSLACVRFDLGENEKAIADLNRYIIKVPNNSLAYKLRASAYTNIANYQAALNDYSNAVLLAPSADTYYDRGVFLLELNYFKEANADLKTALTLGGNNGYAYFYRGVSNVLLGQFKEAISDLSKTITYDTLDFDAYLALAIAYNKIGDIAKAKENFKKANAIISPERIITGIDQYKNTYWFQTRYNYFNRALNALVRLK